VEYALNALQVADIHVMLMILLFVLAVCLVSNILKEIVLGAQITVSLVKMEIALSA
jgi:hypothetical protein